MPADLDTLAARLKAVERALVEADAPPALDESADLVARVDDLEAELAALTERVLALEAVTQALRGYAGHVDHVNRSVERRADAALAAVESLEATTPVQPRYGDEDAVGDAGDDRPTRPADGVDDTEEAGPCSEW